jgi:RHS repeat-associated protein
MNPLPLCRVSVVLAGAVLSLASVARAQGYIPVEACGSPSVGTPGSGSASHADVADPRGAFANQASVPSGSGATTIDTYGTAVHSMVMPSVRTGLSGLATLYPSMLKFNVSYTAWNGSGTSLFGGGLPVPDVTASVLHVPEGPQAEALQPRPGTMPGLYLYSLPNPAGGSAAFTPPEPEAPAPDTWMFLHYGSPIDAGASPQTTAVYAPVRTATDPNTIVYHSNLSGAQIWYYGGAATPYTEVKHVDGTIARFDTFTAWTSTYTSNPANAGKNLWRLTQLRDPYDNTANFVWNAFNRLTEIQFPSGLKQRFNYSPSWPNWSWSGSARGFEVTYEQGSTALPALTWGLVFDGTLGTSGGTHFGSRLARVYSTARDVLVEASGLYDVGSSPPIGAQVVHTFGYTTSTGELAESHTVQTASSAFDATLSPAGAGTQLTLETTFATVGGNAGRAVAQEASMLGEVTTFSYPTSGFRTHDLLSTVDPTGLRGIEAAEPDGTVRRFEYDAISGHVYRFVTTPSNDFTGRPRASHASTENSGINLSGLSTAQDEIEPEYVTVDKVFDGTCTCQKPIEVRVISRRASTDHTRVTKFEYDAESHLVTKRTEMNPQTGTSVPAEIDWDYTYVRAMTTGQEWGAWLPNTEVTPDGKYTYSYDDWLNRSDAANHGRIAGTVERSIASVRIQSTLTGSPTISGTVVIEKLHRNLASNPDGLSQLGSVAGQPRRVKDGDGVATTFEYSAEGWLSAVDHAGGATRTTYSRNDYGEVVSMTENASSPGGSHVATTAFTMISGVGVAKEVSSSSGGLLRKTEFYFDRWGNLAVERSYSRASNGSKPTNHDGSATSARDWVESQHHYLQYRLTDAYRDRERLDLPGGAGQFLQTSLDYVDGRLSFVTNPNGSKTYFDFDGYGSLYRSYTKNPAGTETVTGPKRFVSPFLEVSASYQPRGGEHLWTFVTRNAAGAITEIKEPVGTAPTGYSPSGTGVFSTGGARHVFEIDVLGRVIRASAFENTLLLADRERRYDQIDRLIWQHDNARLRAIDASGTSSAGDHYTAWKYGAGKTAQLDTVERTGAGVTSYIYDSTTGFLKKLIGSLGDEVEYFYHSNTPFLREVKRTDADPEGGDRVTYTFYDADPFGRTTAIKIGQTSQLVHAYAYDSLGRVDKYTDPMGREQKFLPDAMGRIVEHVRKGDSGAYILNTTEFDDAGFSDGRTKVRRADGLGHLTITHFDFAGRPFIVQNPGGLTEPTPSSRNQSMCLYAEYDETSRIGRLYDGDTGTTWFIRDGMGRVIQRELEAVTDDEDIALWNTKDVYRRDAIGRIAQVDYSGGGPNVGHSLLWAVQRTEQDSIGRVHKESYLFANTPGNLIDLTSTYNASDASRQTLHYGDGLGSGGASAFSEPLKMQYGRDAIGRLVDVDWDLTGSGSSFQALAEYEWVGGLRRYRTVHYQNTPEPKGFTAFDYDAHSRLTQIVDDVWADATTHAVKSQFDYEYDAASNLTKERYAKVDGSAGDRFAYDAHHRLTYAWIGVNSATMAASSNPTGFNASTMHADLTYGLDDANNRETTIAETAAGFSNAAYTLESATGSTISNRYATEANSGVEYQYDERGNLAYDGNFYFVYDYANRLQEVWKVEPSGMAAQAGEKFLLNEAQSVVAAREQVMGEVRDLIQRVIQEHMNPVFRARLRKTLTGGVLRLSPGSQTASLTTPTTEPANASLHSVYIYDGFNRRTITVPIGMEVDTQFHTYDGWRQAAQYSVGSDGTNLVAYPSKQFVWGSRLDELIGYRRLVNLGGGSYAWENYFVLHGGQDTAAKLVDEDGDVVEQYEYDPYGRVTVYDGSGALVDLGPAGASPEDGTASAYGLPFMWKGIRREEDTGLLYMRNRYYSLELGRFLTQDPLGTWADLGNGGNGYAYAEGNPGVIGDPFGLQGQRSGGAFSPPPAVDVGAFVRYMNGEGPNPNEQAPEPLPPEWQNPDGSGRCFPRHGPSHPKNERDKPSVPGYKPWNPDADWCGGEGNWTADATPDIDLCVKYCCYLHDACYQKGGADQDRFHCDYAFGDCIFNCGHLLLAGVYHIAVRLAGGLFFNYHAAPSGGGAIQPASRGVIEPTGGGKIGPTGGDCNPSGEKLVKGCPPSLLGTGH